MTKLTDREAILYAFAVEPNHDRNTLERYLRDYPELAEDLIDLTSELRLSEALGPSPAIDAADTGAEAAWQEFLTCKPQETCSAPAANPFARFKGPTFAALADAVNVPRSFLTPFRDGLVAAASIPEAFTRRLAEAMGASVESLQAYFASPAAGARCPRVQVREDAIAPRPDDLSRTRREHRDERRAAAAPSPGL